MTLEFETVEEFSVASEVSDATVTVKLRRMLNHKPSRFSPAPYCLDLAVGSICRHHYGIDELRARDTATRFLLMHVKGIAPLLH
ncbi:hypothetical protein PPGU19_002630 [Paraburkholderia sp. PGU19]|uniref:hypothetical protein n=1 Tax=Paraburkholderia sp. PGU19 TaxID=2735434 RepID=UPI0015DA7AF0|nr:hypothetical protein [Paraburkholderia sp. PGU19]BCF95694.1 hypothetical protein PPGU19_002630 [Paraburkholderia sp. PGU19]